MDEETARCADLWGKVLERVILDEIGMINKRDKAQSYTPDYFTKSKDFEYIMDLNDMHIEYNRKLMLNHIAEGLQKKKNTPKGKRFVYKVKLEVSRQAAAENSARTRLKKKEALRLLPL